MLDFDSGKLLIVGMVALVVIGPKDLPRVLRQVGQAVGKLRRMAGEFQGQFMEAVREADLQDLRQEVAKLKDTASLDVHFDPARDVQSVLTAAIEKPPVADIAMEPRSATAATAAIEKRDAADAGAGPIDMSVMATLPPDVPAPVVAGEARPEVARDADPHRLPRKIAPSRRRDGSRIEPVGVRDRGPGFAPPRPRPQADRDRVEP